MKRVLNQVLSFIPVSMGKTRRIARNLRPALSTHHLNTRPFHSSWPVHSLFPSYGLGQPTLYSLFPSSPQGYMESLSLGCELLEAWDIPQSLAPSMTPWLPVLTRECLRESQGVRLSWWLVRQPRLQSLCKVLWRKVLMRSCYEIRKGSLTEYNRRLFWRRY